MTLSSPTTCSFDLLLCRCTVDKLMMHLIPQSREWKRENSKHGEVVLGEKKITDEERGEFDIKSFWKIIIFWKNRCELMGLRGIAPTQVGGYRQVE